MQSIMPSQQHFAKVPQIGGIQRSVFDRTHGHKTTFDADYLIPFYVDEILPGDTQQLKASIFARLATPIYPIMDNMFMETFYFFVPSRIIWEHWEEFNGASDTAGVQPTEYSIPQQEFEIGIDEGTLPSYLGLPNTLGDQANNLIVNSLPFRAYNQIFNDWFRDENLQDKVTVDIGDGPDNEANYVILKRGKRHDYFTSCLPYPQKSDETVSIPLTGDAPVIGNGQTLGFTVSGTHYGLYADTAVSIGVAGNFNNQSLPINQSPSGFLSTNDGIGVSGNANVSGLIADLSSVSAIDINQLREAISIQHVLELDARGGTRYVEMLKAHFGVTSPDFRLQRAEYLGGSSDSIQINPVAQTSETSGQTTEKGSLSAFVTVSSNNGGYNKSFTEHGYVIGLVNIRADLTYQYGVDRFWYRETRYDFYLPSFAHLGEQAVSEHEIFWNAAEARGAEPVFGYQERWAEYRYKPSIISGDFLSSAAQSLDAWHLAEEHSVAPTLNSAFIQSNNIPAIDRAIAVPSEPQFIFDSYIKLRHARPMPMYSVPGLKRL